MLRRCGSTVVTASVLFLIATLAMHGQSIAVRHAVGASHGFVVVRDESGGVIGYGESTQIASAGHITSRLTYHLRDGSIDDEAAVFTQRGTFHLVSDHHIQRGPFFSKATDILVQADGQITTRSTGKDGNPKVETQHIDLPPDVANGFVGSILVNVAANSPEFKIPMIAPSGKGRLIHLDIAPAGESPFTIAGAKRKATLFRIHTDLGGVAGVVAPVIGKQPADIFVWVLEGQPPAVLREVGQLSEGGPIVSIESAGTVFPPAASEKR